MVETAARIIPSQLHGEKFLILHSSSKEPVHNWRNPLYQFTAEEAQEFLDNGFNYGVVYTSDLAVLDGDDLDELERRGIIQQLPETFRVKSGRAAPRGMHFYFRVHNVPEVWQKKKLILTNPDTGKDMGDIRLPQSAFYNVGPYSIHPKTKRMYTPENLSANIATIDFNDLYKVVKDYTKDLEKEAEKRRCVPLEEIEERISRQKEKYGDEGLEAYGYDVFDFLYPEGAKQRPGTDEIEGAHPVHGSSTGTNLTVLSDGSLWYCRAHQTGGNWIDALAVKYGIIRCEECTGNKKYSPEEWRQIHAVLRDLNPKIHRRNYLRYQRERLRRLHEEQT